MPYEGGEKFDKMAAESTKKKDFIPATKTLQKKLEKARVEADGVYPLGLKQRLDKLGLIYIMIERRKSSKMPATAATQFAAPSPKPFNTSLPAAALAPAAESSSPVIAKKTSPVVAKKSTPVVAKKSTPVPVVAKKSAPPPRVDSPVTSAAVAKTPKSAKKKPATPKRKKRPVAAAQEVNLDDSVGPNDSGVDSGKTSDTDNSTSSTPAATPAKKKRKSAGKKAPTPLAKVEPESKVEEEEEPPVVNGQGDDADFGSDGEDNNLPRLGSLVWGRMKGFPFWPCFVVKSAQTGSFVRDHPPLANSNKPRRDYHVQFFNWNNETGWVARTLPWCSMEVRVFEKL